MSRRVFHSRNSRLSLSGFAVLLVSVGVAAAESNPESYKQPPGPFHHPIPPYPVEMGFTQHHSSTAYEGWQRGRAALIQAWGNYQLSESQAEILSEQARWMNRENDLKQTEALHAQQAMWRQARKQLRADQDASQAEGQKKLAARRATVYRDVYRLSASQFDRTTGQITWPVVLQDAKYQAACDRVNELFRTHVGYGEPQPVTADEIARCIEPLIRALRKDVSNVTRTDYLAAQKFLISLKYEAKSLAETA
ncbi:MAG: hypothetical protein WD738_15225 [Pirellulales bacterium]